ncbi:MAG TPA: ATP12 family protein [Stellaceae bacterium]|nr:ATP12 family protein [Stellaceae bacterium]
MAERPRRLYRAAGTVEAEGGGFLVVLDDKPVRTPAKAPLAVPSRALGEAIAAEWEAQSERIDPDSMPLTRIASIAIDLVAPRRASVIGEIAKYAGTDLVCYRAERPQALVERQHAAWQPLVDWTRERYGAELAVTAGIVPREQPEAALGALADAIAAHDSMRLAALHLACAACGSVVLALALVEGRIDAAAAFAAAELDQTFEIEQWGEDAEQTRRRALLSAEIAAAARFLELLGA